MEATLTFKYPSTQPGYTRPINQSLRFPIDAWAKKKGGAFNVAGK
jgi:hypothetical protein